MLIVTCSCHSFSIERQEHRSSLSAFLPTSDLYRRPWSSALLDDRLSIPEEWRREERFCNSILHLFVEIE